MPVNPLCQPIATDLSALQLQRDNARAALPGLVSPADRWTALAGIGNLDRQIAEKQRDLDDCQRQHAAAYEAELVAFDTTGAPAPARIARLWQTDGAVPTVVESSPVVGGQLAFAAPLDADLLGVTVEETGNPAVQGLDFRSGPITELPRNAPDDPSGRIEVVLGPRLTFTNEELQAWLATVPLPQHTSTPLGASVPESLAGNADITIASLGLTLMAGAIRLVASGTAAITGPLYGSALAPFTLEVRLRLGLPVTPDVDHSCDVRITGSPTLTVGGPFGDVLTPLTNLLRDFVAAPTVPVLQEAVNDAVPPAVAAAFGLDDLPPGVVASLRQFEITPTGITVAATLGAFGDVLSTFEP